MKLRFFLFPLFLFVQLFHISNAEEKFCKVYNETVTNISGDWSCRLKGCLVKISRKENHVIRLTTSYYHPQIWETIYVDGREFRIFRRNYSREYGQLMYESMIGSGFIFKMPQCDEPLGFERIAVKSKEAECGPTIRRIGRKIETFEKEDCKYHLIPENYNDTLVVYSPDMSAEVFTWNQKKREEYVEVSPAEPYVVYVRKYRGYGTIKFQTTTIGESDVEKDCKCSPDFNLTSEMISIKSPGFPNTFCPNRECKTRISVLPLTSETPEVTERFLFSVNAIAHPNAKFELSDLFSFNSKTFTNLSTSFLMKPTDFKLVYKTDKVLSSSPGIMGQFEVNVSRMWIKEDCDCSTFFDRTYAVDHVVELHIPANCEFMMCSWSFRTRHSGKLTLELNNASSSDEIHVWSKGIIEIYTGQQLELPRQVNVPTATNWVHVNFHRRNNTDNSTLKINWKAIENTGCPIDIINVTNVKLPLTSPNYPLPYEFADLCQYRLEASQNHRIIIKLDDFDVEKLHDHLKIFDGNSTEARLISVFTGKHGNETISSTNSSMFLLFNSDAHTALKGFHLTVFAEPNDIDAESSKWPIYVLLFLILTILIVLAVFFIIKKKEPTMTRLRNSLVRFNNDGSEVSISNVLN